MIETLSESLPFADIEEVEEFSIEHIQQMVESVLNKAYAAGEIREDDYRKMSADVCEVHGDPYDYFIGIWQRIIDCVDETNLERIRKGAEFIDSLSKLDPRYIPAVERYNMLCQKIRRGT